MHVACCLTERQCARRSIGGVLGHLCHCLGWCSCHYHQWSTSRRQTVCYVCTLGPPLFVIESTFIQSNLVLKINSSFFQSVCLLGYCIFPILLSAVACLCINSVTKPALAVVLRFITVVFALCWALWGMFQAFNQSESFIFISVFFYTVVVVLDVLADIFFAQFLSTVVQLHQAF